MPSSPPFVDQSTGELDTSQIWTEAVPLAALVALFGALALVPFALVLLVGVASSLGVILTVASQFVLAVGAGVVLMYVVARGIQLADE